jgi:hypothetical protein
MKNLIATTLLILLLLTISSFAQISTKNGVSTEYDRFEDSTTVSVDFQLERKLSLTFSNTFDGKKRTSTPKNISISFISLDISEQYLYSYSCIFLVDDQRISLDSKHYIRQGDGELRSFSLTLEDLKKIANAKKVEMKLSSRIHILTESQLATLKEFYKQLIP